jgi:hypothetical protein
MNAGMKTFLLWMAVLLAVYLFVEFSNNFKGTIVRVDFSEFQKDLREGKVTKLSIRGSEIAGERKDAAVK